MRHLAACGKLHSIFVLNGQAYSCGQNELGQLGLGYYNKEVSTPTQIKQFIDGKGRRVEVEIVFVACGELHSIFITKDGRVFACGNNSAGQVGAGKRNNRNGQCYAKPREIKKKYFLNKRVVFADAGIQHSVFITQDGEAFGCGENVEFQLGNTCKLGRGYSWHPISLDIKNLVGYVACGGNYSIFVKTNGDALFCGDDKIKAILKSFGEEIVSAACGKGFFALLSEKGNAFLWDIEEFKQIKRLNQHICCKSFSFVAFRDEQCMLVSAGGQKVYNLGIYRNKRTKEIVCGTASVYRPGEGKYASCFPPLNNCLVYNRKKEERKIVSAACGEKHSILVTLFGEVFTRGSNSDGQAGWGKEKTQFFHYRRILRLL